MHGLKHLSYQEAEQLHKKQWLEGKHKEWGDAEEDHFFPYGDQYKKDGFVEVEIPTKDIESAAHDRKRIDQYKEILKKQGEKSRGSLWVSAGRQKNDGTIVRQTDQGRRPSFSALDGNHRLKAAQELGHPTQIAILPATHWKAYKGGAVVLIAFKTRVQAKYCIAVIEDHEQEIEKWSSVLGVPLKFDPNSRHEADVRHDFIYLGKKFFLLPDDGAKKHVLYHEYGHFKELDMEALKDMHFWDLVQKQDAFGKIRDDGSIDGINHQRTPGENVVEAYACLIDDGQWLKERYPLAYKYVKDLATKHNLPLKPWL